MSKNVKQCWKCGDMDDSFQVKCEVPACGMKESSEWVGLDEIDLAGCDSEEDVRIARYWERILKAKNV